MREMFFRMAPVVVWLATFSDAKRKLADQRLKHCNINFEAESSLEIHSFLSEFEQQEGYDLGTACKVMWPSSHEVVGLALIEPHSMHHALLEVCSDMRAQYNFWSVLDNSVLNAALYYLSCAQDTIAEPPGWFARHKNWANNLLFRVEHDLGISHVQPTSPWNVSG